MQLFELVSPRLFRPLAGPNRAFYAELLLLLWEECRHTADYSISRAEAVSRAEDYFAALAKPLALDADGAGDEDEQPTRDPHTLAVGFLLRLRRTGWLEEQPGSYETEPTLAFMPEVTPLLDALEEILNPRVVTYTGKLYKAWQLLGSIGQEKSPYENVLREVAADLETLNKSLRALNASIGHYIDRLTHNRTPQEVLELFDQYEEKVVAAAYHRFKTSDNLFNYRAYLEEELDDCEQNQLPRLALDYARVERCAPGEAAPRVRALIQQQRDALEEMSTLMRQIDQSHIRYRKRAVQRAQFLLLSDRSAQGSVTALLRRYAEEIKTPDQLFEPDDGPLAGRLHLWPVQVFGEKPLYPPAAPRTDMPLAPVQAGQLADVLPILKQNKSEYFVFVGNDPHAVEVMQAMQRPVDKIAFGFQNNAGRREHDRLVSVHMGMGMTVGGATAPLSGAFRLRLQAAFEGTHYKLTYYSDMDEWLKSHIAFILPCAYACYAVDGELSRTTVEQRRMIVDAAWECCEMLKAAGVPVNDAENTDRYREGTKQRKKTERMVYWMAQTVVGKWCISDHAMRAVSEMQYLDEAFAALRATTLVEMTAWDELRRSLPRKK